MAAAGADPLTPPLPADIHERWSLAGNSSTPPATLTALAADPDPWVRRDVAGNQSTPPGTLTALAADPELEVRLTALENPNCGPAGLAAGGLLAD